VHHLVVDVITVVVAAALVVSHVTDVPSLSPSSSVVAVAFVAVSHVCVRAPLVVVVVCSTSKSLPSSSSSASSPSLQSPSSS